MSDDKILVCKKDNTVLRWAKTAGGAERLICWKCDKFVFLKDVHEQTAQEFEIAMKLQVIDNILKEIWHVAFEDPRFDKMKPGIPEHGIGDVYIAVHVVQGRLRGEIADEDGGKWELPVARPKR
jgi:hypothetical protein